ncbi:protein brambleberry isoform X2 [Scyliorhinus canicula]|uniref:protein brambleberry isoform X2 n=1 Tax=Scyliorhinus canicula TaxID=7830 RepID=UPI0018F4D1BD|nr:protein brambleberry isoform X2 [Scyliorhinus canicula]
MQGGPRLLLLLALSCLAAGRCRAAFGWFRRQEGAGAPGSSPTPGGRLAVAGPSHPPFEMSAVDERFVSEGRRLELSLLDSCHQAVIAQLKSSCIDLSEEELAKLGVSLFNCQAAAEGRLTYPCTADMTLAECTADMDPDTWNAYHIVSNRARSVCYATRQQDFKRRTEVTVNSLVVSASSQLEAMKMLKNGQKELRDLTASSLEKVVKSQNELLEQQEQLQDGQQDLESSINGNLEKLAKEKELIASGHQQVARLIEGITLTMENVSRQLAHQDSELQEGHRAILTDLLEVRARAHQVYTKLDSNLALFSAHQSQTAIYYDQLMEKLQKMNQTVGMVMNMIDHLELGVSQRLNSIQHFLSWTGNNLHVIYTCTVHVSYFLVAALIMTFLQTPGNWMLINYLSFWKRKVLQGHPSTPVIVPSNLYNSQTGFRTSTPERKHDILSLEEELEKLECDGLPDNYGLRNADFIRSSPVIETPAQASSHTATPLEYVSKTPISSMPILKKRLGLTNSARWEVTQRNIVVEGASLNPSACVCEAETFNLNHSAASSGSLSQRQPCCGITKTGQPCRNKAVTGQEFCRVHSSGQTS